MSRSVETRLRKLEAASPDRKALLFVIERTTPSERDAYVDQLISSGEARATDWFIDTGVQRSPEFGGLE